MALPTLVDSLPSSFRVSTVMLTEVAVSTTPRNRSCRNLLPGMASSPVLKMNISPVPMASGTSTPAMAITRPALPVCFSSFRSVPMPALNMMTITPSSATCDRKSLGWMMFSTAGPITRPATSAPTTWGICSLPVSMLSALVASRIRARSARYP